MSTSPPVHFVMGFPAQPLAGRLTRALLDDREATIRLLVPRASATEARAFLSSLDPQQERRVVVLEGDAWAIDFGLSGSEWGDLAAEVTVIHHAAQLTALGLERDDAMRKNRGATVEAVELAERAPRLDRLIVWSSASVSGARKGFVLEEELDLSAPARNGVEESLRRSELLVLARRGSLPVTIVRPGILVGDSRTGALDEREGMYQLLTMMLSAPDLPMPMPVRGDVPLSLVPIDYAVRAGLYVSTDPRARGRTFHVVDPDPLTAGRALQLMAEQVGRPVPQSILPPFLAQRLMRIPFIQPGGAAPLPRAFLDQLSTEVVYDDRGTRSLLVGSGITCPAFESYVGTMVRYVRDRQLGGPAFHEARAAREVV